MRCFLWVWADMGFNLLVGHLGCLHFVSPNMQISFIREKWYLSLLSDLLWGQNSHKYPDYFKAIGVNNINNKKHYRSLFLLDHQHLANLWSWRLQVSQPALSLNSGLHLQERWLTMAHPWQSGYGLRSHHSRALTVIALSLSHYLWPVFLPVSLRHCLSFGDLLHIQSKPLPSSFFIDLVTHLSLAETIFLDICQSSSNSLIAFLFWVKADSPLDSQSSFWTLASNQDGAIWARFTLPHETMREYCNSILKMSENKEQWFWVGKQGEHCNVPAYYVEKVSRWQCTKGTQV